MGSKLCHQHLAVAPLYYSMSGSVVEFVPITRFSAEEHRARVDGRATARHLHGKIERAVRCVTVKVSAESAGAVASNVFFESLTTQHSGRFAQPGGGAGRWNTNPRSPRDLLGSPDLIAPSVGPRNWMNPFRIPADRQEPRAFVELAPGICISA